MDFKIELEDEFEDIVGKAENGLGKKVTSLELNVVCKELNLNLKALKKIKDKKYFPEEYNFNSDDDLKVERIQVKFYEGFVNSYLLIKDNKCVVIDTCGDADSVIEKIESLRLKPEFILLTHGHNDHTGGLGEIEDFYKIKVNKKDEIKFKDYKIIRIPIPGHTNDSVAFCVDKFLFVGDLIFAGSLGSGSFSYKKLLESFKKILSLNKDYFIFPGHGPSTTIEQERENNAFNNS